MKYVFRFENHTYQSEDFQEVAEYVMNWVDDNWDDFVEWTNYLVTKDNFEQYIEDFITEKIIEKE